MKIITREGVVKNPESASNRFGAEKPVEISVNPEDKGTYMAMGGNGMNDEAIILFVNAYKVAFNKNKEEWDRFRANEKARSWAGRLFSNKIRVPPAPPQIPTYIEARARELGLL